MRWNKEKREEGGNEVGRERGRGEQGARRTSSRKLVNAACVVTPRDAREVNFQGKYRSRGERGCWIQLIDALNAICGN